MLATAPQLPSPQRDDDAAMEDSQQPQFMTRSQSKILDSFEELNKGLQPLVLLEEVKTLVQQGSVRPTVYENLYKDNVTSRKNNSSAKAAAAAAASPGSSCDLPILRSGFLDCRVGGKFSRKWVILYPHALDICKLPTSKTHELSYSLNDLFIDVRVDLPGLGDNEFEVSWPTKKLMFRCAIQDKSEWVEAIRSALETVEASRTEKDAPVLLNKHRTTKEELQREFEARTANYLLTLKSMQARMRTMQEVENLTTKRPSMSPLLSHHKKTVDGEGNGGVRITSMPKRPSIITTESPNASPPPFGDVALPTTTTTVTTTDTHQPKPSSMRHDNVDDDTVIIPTNRAEPPGLKHELSLHIAGRMNTHQHDDDVESKEQTSPPSAIVVEERVRPPSPPTIVTAVIKARASTSAVISSSMFTPAGTDFGKPRSSTLSVTPSMASAEAEGMLSMARHRASVAAQTLEELESELMELRDREVECRNTLKQVKKRQEERNEKLSNLNVAKRITASKLQQSTETEAEFEITFKQMTFALRQLLEVDNKGPEVTRNAMRKTRDELETKIRDIDGKIMELEQQGPGLVKEMADVLAESEQLGRAVSEVLNKIKDAHSEFLIASKTEAELAAARQGGKR